MDRVFTPDERRMIRDGSDPDLVLWSLWAGKETGYKAARRLCPSVSSAPRRYAVRLSSTGEDVPASGTVQTPAGPVFIRFRVSGDYVHCVGTVTEGGVDAVVCDVRRMPRARSLPDESAFIRRMARRSIAAWLGEEPQAVEIVRRREGGGLAPPVVRIRGRAPAIGLSMSHDGRFAACAFSIMPGLP